MVAAGLQDARPDRGVVVLERRQAGDGRAPFADHGAQHQRVILDDVARPHVAAGRHQLGARRLDGHPRLAAHAKPRMAGTGRRADILRPQQMIGRQDQLGRDDVFAHRPHMLPRRHRGQHLDRLPAGLLLCRFAALLICRLAFFPHLHIFHHDHRVRAGGQGIAGVHVERLLADGQVDRPRFGCAARVFGAHRVAVHGGGMIMGRGDERPHRLGRDAAGRVLQRHPFALQRPVEAGLRQRREPARQSFFARDVFQVWRMSMMCGHGMITPGCAKPRAPGFHRPRRS